MREERRSPNLLLTVIVPAYNEFQTVEVALRRVRAVPLRLEIIVVNDASTDGTREVLDDLAKQGLVDRVIHQAPCPVVIMPPKVSGYPETLLSRVARAVACNVAEAAATAGRPGMRPPRADPAREP